MLLDVSSAKLFTGYKNTYKAEIQCKDFIRASWEGQTGLHISNSAHKKLVSSGVRIYCGRVDQRMQIGLHERVDNGLLLGSWILVWRSCIAKDGRVDTVVKTLKFCLSSIRLCSDPIIADRLVCFKLFRVYSKPDRNLLSRITLTMNEYR